MKQSDAVVETRCLGFAGKRHISNARESTKELNESLVDPQ